MKPAVSFSLLLAAALQAPSLIYAAPVDSDPCTAIADKPFVVPSQALACLTSFPYNETIQTNVMSNAERVMDFFSFEPYYKNSPSPFQESTVQIREEFSRIKRTEYKASLISAVRDVVSHISVCSRTTISIVTSITSPCR